MNHPMIQCESAADVFDGFVEMFPQSSWAAMHAICECLERLRQRMNSTVWKDMCLDFQNGAFPVARDLLFRDPFTRHSANRPRGYPGDAELIDHIYDLDVRTEQDHVGSQVGAYALRSLASTAVRTRRDVIASAIEATVSGNPSARVLAMACGHLREALQVRSLDSGGYILALDQDEQSLQEVHRACGQFNVESFKASVNDWIRGKLTLNGFDLVYAAGLYDYLSQPLATVLTRRLLESVGPGGRLLIPNFLPGIRDRGYMECVMNWPLVYRDEAQMRALLHSVPPGQVASVLVFREPTDNIVFLEVVRA